MAKSQDSPGEDEGACGGGIGTADQIRDTLLDRGPMGETELEPLLADDLNPGMGPGVSHLRLTFPAATSLGGPTSRKVYYVVNEHSKREVMDAWFEANMWVTEESTPTAVMKSAEGRGFKDAAVEAADEYFSDEAWEDSYANVGGNNDGGSKAIYRAALEAGEDGA